MMVLFAQPGGCCGHHVDTVALIIADVMASWHLHHRGRDCGCGGAVGIDLHNAYARLGRDLDPQYPVQCIH